MSVVEFKDLSAIREKHADERIAVCAGCFDLTHAGHVLFLEDCKKYGDILVVLVGRDYNVRLNKGDERPFMNEYVRLKMISSLKPVDYALLDLEAETDDTLAILRRVFAELRPDYYIINTDAFDLPRRHKLVEGFATQLLILDRACPPEFDTISTTKIVEKIQKSAKKQSSI